MFGSMMGWPQLDLCRVPGWARVMRRVGAACHLVAALCSCSSGSSSSGEAFVTGEPQRFSFEVESRVEGGNASTAAAGSGNKRYALKGRVVLLPLSVAGTDTTLHLKLEGLSVEASNAAEKAALEKLLPILGEPAALELRDGSRRSLRVSPGVPLQAYGWLSSVAGVLQWPEAGRDGARTIEEKDATGVYEARIERTEGGLRKVKKRYRKLTSRGLGSADRQLLPEVVTSEATRTPARGPIAGVSLHETLRTEMIGGGHLAVTTDVQLTAVAPGEGSARVAAKELEEATREVADLVVFSPPTPREGAFDAQRIASATLDGTLREIAELDPSASSGAKPGGSTGAEAATSEFLHRFSLIAAMLRQRPGDVQRAEALIRERHPRAAMLVQALASAGTDETQAVLRRLALEKRDDTSTIGPSAEVVARAATGLVRVQQATPPTVELLQQWATDPKREEHGIYGLGTAARRLRQRGQEQRARAIADFLSVQLKEAKRNLRVELVLRGIANSADARLFEQVKAQANNDDPGIRTAVIDAVRFMDHRAVDEFLLERAKVEDDTRVLRSLLDTFSARKPSKQLVEAVSELTGSRQRYGVRFTAVEQAGKWLEQRAELRPLLQKVSEGDAREEVRLLARKMLKPRGKDT